MKKIVINRNLLIVILSIVLTTIGVMILEMLISLMKANSDSAAANVMLEITVLVIPCLVVRRYSNNKFSLEQIGMKINENTFKLIEIGLLAGIAVWLSTYFILYFMNAYNYLGFGFQFYSNKIVVLSLLTGFIRFLFAGTCEEVFYRGVLLNYLAKYKGKVFAIIISSVIFSMSHITRYLDFRQLFSIFFLGVIFGCCYVFTKSIYFSMGIHFGIDLFSNFVGIYGQPSLFMINISTKFGQASFEQSYIMINAITTLILIAVVFVISIKRKSVDTK